MGKVISGLSVRGAALRISALAMACAAVAGCEFDVSSASLDTSPQASKPGLTVVVSKSEDSEGSHLVIRQTSEGFVMGVNDSLRNGTYAWKGLPFAEPPVGDLRWRAPVDRKPWLGVRHADKFGSACLQIGRIYGPGSNNRFDETIGTTLGQPVGAEDCLTLNIWRPATSERQLPVLMFLHGGSGVSGYTADPLYDGAALARAANAVVVTANYRLGLFGGLYLPQLRTGSGNGEDSGNFVLLDNIAALRYLQRNIAAFGGNPGNVTLAGQSAGAVALLALLVSPKAEGLFHKAMPLSGGISLASNLPQGSVPTLKPAPEAAKRSQAFLEGWLVAAGVVPNVEAAREYIASQPPGEIAAYLRRQDPRALLSFAAPRDLNGTGLVPEGEVLPVDPISSIAAGHYNRMPVLAGITREEGKLFAGLLASLGLKPGFKVNEPHLFKILYEADPERPSVTAGDVIDETYLPVDKPLTGFNARTGFITNILAVSNRNNLLDTLRTQQSNVWNYRFDWAQQPAPWNDIYGAAHGMDVGFLFGNFGPSLFSRVSYSTANRPGREDLSKAMMASVSAFLRTGDPNTPALGGPWAPWPAVLSLDATPNAARISVSAAPGR